MRLFARIFVNLYNTSQTIMQYRCSICGYVYDDDKEGIAFTDLPESWQCPWCGAPKSAFEPAVDAPSGKAVPSQVQAPVLSGELPDMSMTKLSIGQMAALCSNLARGCEKQYMPDEMVLFNELAEWFTSHSAKVEDATVETVSAQLQRDLEDFSSVRQTGVEHSDRGAQRVCVWGEKATLMLSSLMSRYQKEGDSLLAGTEIWVCTVCGFVYIGIAAPDLCPVCKVPSWKFNQVERRK